MKLIKKPAEYVIRLEREDWTPIIERAIRLDNPDLPSGKPGVFVYSTVQGDRLLFTFKEEE